MEPTESERIRNGGMTTISEAPKIAFSWGSHNSNFTMVCGTYNKLVNGAFVNQQTSRLGASHCRNGDAEARFEFSQVFSDLEKS